MCAMCVKISKEKLFIVQEFQNGTFFQENNYEYRHIGEILVLSVWLVDDRNIG